jgi:hypothetical protein
LKLTATCLWTLHVGIKVLRREVLRKNAIIYFDVDGFELDFNAKKSKEAYLEQITSISHFIETRREMIVPLGINSASNEV